MVTTSGAAAPAHQAHEPAGSPRRTRERLIAVVRSVEAYVAGRDCIPAAPPSAPPSPPVLHGVAGASEPSIVLPPGPDPAGDPPRPRPLDKPFTVAHYQAMARQVAYERQVSQFDALPQPSSPFAPGGRRHG
jgi:hypothetical protein